MRGHRPRRRLPGTVHRRARTNRRTGGATRPGPRTVRPAGREPSGWSPPVRRNTGPRGDRPRHRPRGARDGFRAHGGMRFTRGRAFLCTAEAPRCGPCVPEVPRRVMIRSLSNRSPEAPAPPPCLRCRGSLRVNVADCGIRTSRSVETGLCPTRDSSRPGVGRPLRYLVWDASGCEHAPHRSCPRGESGTAGAFRRSPRHQADCHRLFELPGRASHSIPYGYSFALEYARSACWRDCTSTMLAHKGFTFRDPCPGRCPGHAENGYDRGPREARVQVSAGSDGVSGAGASSAAGDPARPC